MANVLIVDDEKSIRITLQAFLEEQGHAVSLARDAGEAEKALRKGCIDVVVTDIVLPGLSGVDLLESLRKNAPRVPVIMMTGEPSVETAAAAVKAGAYDYLSKPVGKKAICKVVSDAADAKELDDINRRLAEKDREYRRDLEKLVEARTRALEETVARLKDARQQLGQQDRLNALGQMASGIAHDFNNVLMPILGMSDMLVHDPSALDNREEAMEMLQTIWSASLDARQIVRRLRQIYKEDLTEYWSVDLATVVDTAVSLTKPKWREEMNAKGTTIEVVQEIEDVPAIKGNTTELREAITNLIFNAVDAMPKGGTITLRLFRDENGDVALEIHDTGMGMNEEALDHCFEPFYTTKGVRGTGLGLPMVYGIVERHGGTTQISSQIGSGTTISMTFPAATEDQLVAQKTAADVQPLSPLRILIIDDEESSLSLLDKLLTADGHEVRLAETGEDGLRLLERENFNLIITDRAMPSMSGDEVALIASRKWPEVPVVMLTGFGDIMKDEGRCPEGVTFLMTKPVTNKDLRCVMRKVLFQEDDSTTSVG